MLERVKMMLEDRTKSRDQLLKLSGRLEMLMMQVVRRTRNMDPSNLDAGKVNALVSTPMALYEDDVEDDAEPVDMDIVPPAADDEDEVEEDKDKSDDEEAMEESDDDEEAQE